MPAPYFSVVIPTRNRPNYLGDAMASVLLQDFEDLECVVSDNFNDESTRATVDLHAGDSRLRYFRTPRLLTMLDHWEFASLKARGEVVLMLADRKLLRQGALRKIHARLAEYAQANVFTVGTQVYDDVRGQMGWSPPHRRTHLYDSVDLVRNFLSENCFGERTLDPLFPKAHNGGYRRGLAARVRAVTGQYFNNPGVTTPDYSSSFANCALEPSVLHVGERLMLTQGESTSNGRLFGAGNTAAYMRDLPADTCADVPFKEPFIYNLLMVDYLKIRRALGGNLAGLEPDWPRYFRTLYAEYSLKRRAALLSPAELDRLLDAWKRSCVALLGDGADEEVVRVFEREGQEARGRLSLDPLAHLRDFLNHRFSQFGVVNRLTKFRFKRALDAAGFEAGTDARFGVRNDAPVEVER